MNKRTDKQIVDALEKNGGSITQTAQALGMTREGLSRRINKSEKLKEAKEDAVECILDLAETELREKVKAGSEKAIIYTLSTLGRSRGYGSTKNVVIETKPRNDAEILAAMREALGLPPEDSPQA